MMMMAMMSSTVKRSLYGVQTLRGPSRLDLNSLQLKAGLTSKVVTVTSGKGGVGKTTTAASFAYGLAEEGYKTCVIDFDIGLR